MYKRLLKICLLNLEVDSSIMAGVVPGSTVKGRGFLLSTVKLSLSIFLKPLSCSRFALYTYQPWSNFIQAL